MKILRLGHWAHTADLSNCRLRDAAQAAHRLSFDAAHIELRDGPMLILARPPSPRRNPEHFHLTPGLPERPELIGWHQGDTSTPCPLRIL